MTLNHPFAFAAALASLLLAGCASSPQGPGMSTTKPAPVVTRQATGANGELGPLTREPVTATPIPGQKPGSAAKIVQKRGGGYYKDDGPGDSPPPNLDAIPDAVPQAEPLNPFANNPYSVFGRDYIPATSLKPYRSRGVASWYGKKFHGQPTSSGELYDMYGMTAAHPTLPIPSYARVTNIANGRSVIVRINDRGPFIADRLMDLSFTAAYKLGYSDTGSTTIEVEQIIPEGVETIAANIPPIRQRPARRPVAVRKALAKPAASPASESTVSIASTVSASTPDEAVASASTGLHPVHTARPRGIFLQLGAFANAENANGFRALVAHEVDWLASKLQILISDGRFRLHAGPFASDSEARSAAEQIASQLRLKPFVVTH